MPGRAAPRSPSAWWSGTYAEDLVDVVDLRDHPEVLDASGWWAVVAEFEGAATGHRFARTTRGPLPAAGPWTGPDRTAWTSSLDEEAYTAGVRAVRERVREGEVYQVNLCRVLSAPLPGSPDPWALAAVLASGNPAPHAGVLDLGDSWVVSASPELFLARDGDRLASAPVKGTAVTAAGLLEKDVAENVMITDLVRNDLQRVCEPGTVEVDGLLRVEQHPGLVHLVSTVRGHLRTGTGWGEVLTATSPPGSVSGAPKSSALQTISELEPVPRGPYCGGVGFVDADTRTARLAVGIRTFWWRDGVLRFGTGAGITWGSDPAAEWAETELKASRLLALASGTLAG